MRLTLFAIQLFIIFPLFSKNSSSNEIDRLLKESFQKFSDFELLESVRLADQALQLSISDNYSVGKVKSGIYISKVLVEIGLNMESLKYLESIHEEPIFSKDVISHVEFHRLRGKIYGGQQLYTLGKREFNKQLLLSESILDPKKRELSKLWAYQNIEHLFYMQGISDSIEVYQNLQEEQLLHFEEHEVFHYISELNANKGRQYMNDNRFDEAAILLQKSIDMLNNYNFPYKYYTLQIFGNLEAARGNVEKAIFYYNEALENSSSLDVVNSSCELHKKLADYMFDNGVYIDQAKDHLKEYTILNDSLKNHNKMVVDAVFENIIKENDQWIAQKSKIVWYIVLVLILVSIIIVAILIERRLKRRKMLIKLNQRLVSKSEKIESLEEKLKNNTFNYIIELAKSNSPEFLPLFRKSYPEFIEAMKQLDPACRSSELYFCALAYLNFSTKDIANYTFVSIRAVQIRKNRMRKKYNIPSEVDFNEWFRNLVNRKVSIGDVEKG